MAHTSPHPNPDITYIHPDHVERVGGGGGPVPEGALEPPPLPPLLNLPELIARYGPMAQGVWSRIQRARAMAPSAPTPSPAPADPGVGAPGGTPTPPTAISGRTPTRTAVGYLLAGLAGVVATGLAVAAYSAVQQSGYNQAANDIGDGTLSRTQKRRRRRKRNRRRHQRARA